MQILYKKIGEGTAPTEGRVARPDGGAAAAAIPRSVAQKLLLTYDNLS